MTLRLKLMDELIPAMAAMTGSGLYHCAIGSRILQSEFAETKGQRGSQAPEAILDAAPEVDGRSFLVVIGRTSNLCDRIAVPYNLDKHLVIEHEIV